MVLWSVLCFLQIAVKGKRRPSESRNRGHLHISIFTLFSTNPKVKYIFLVFTYFFPYMSFSSGGNARANIILTPFEMKFFPPLQPYSMGPSLVPFFGFYLLGESFLRSHLITGVIFLHVSAALSGGLLYLILGDKLQAPFWHVNSLILLPDSMLASSSISR